MGRLKGWNAFWEGKPWLNYSVSDMDEFIYRTLRLEKRRTTRGRAAPLPKRAAPRVAAVNAPCVLCRGSEAVCFEAWFPIGANIGPHRVCAFCLGKVVNRGAPWEFTPPKEWFRGSGIFLKGIGETRKPGSHRGPY